MRHAKGFFPHFPHSHAIGKQPNLLEPLALAGCERAGHGIGILRFDANDLNTWPEGFDVGANPSNQPPSPHGQVDRRRWFIALAQDFHANGSLPSDDIGVIEGMDKTQPPLLLQDSGMGLGRVKAVAIEHHFSAAATHRFNLGARRCHRHHDHR